MVELEDNIKKNLEESPKVLRRVAHPTISEFPFTQKT
jgi:preprotein translocase subunit Sss1